MVVLLLFYYLFITLVTGVIWAHTISVCLPSTSFFLIWKSSLAMETLIYVSGFVILIDVALSDDLMVRQILMLCVRGCTSAILDQFDEKQGDPQNYNELREQLNAVFDSDSNYEAHMTAFEHSMQRISESEEEFVAYLLLLYKAADPQAKANVINHAITCKFLQGISDTL